ncbi:MAG: transcriptional regulator [Bacteroidota bacterium]
MKKLLTGLNKEFDNRVRLGIMSVLMVNEWADFNLLKITLELTDGRLASHIKSLEAAKYIEIKKQFIGKKPNTSYRATENGRKAFNDHLNALEALINLNKDE